MRSVLGNNRLDLSKLPYHHLEKTPNQLSHEDCSLFAHGLGSDVGHVHPARLYLLPHAFTDLNEPQYRSLLCSANRTFISIGQG